MIVTLRESRAELHIPHKKILLVSWDGKGSEVHVAHSWALPEEAIQAQKIRGDECVYLVGGEASTHPHGAVAYWRLLVRGNVLGELIQELARLEFKVDDLEQAVHSLEPLAGP